MAEWMPGQMGSGSNKGHAGDMQYLVKSKEDKAFNI